MSLTLTSLNFREKDKKKSQQTHVGDKGSDVCRQPGNGPNNSFFAALAFLHTSLQTYRQGKRFVH